METTKHSLLRKAFSLLFIVAAAIVLSRCAPTQPAPLAQLKVIAPPFANVDVPFREMKFKAEEGATFRMSNGTVIEVPPGVMVDETGSAIQGEVDLKYREFHTVADILASGITMKYTEGGAKETLETAGMMEMHASQHGNEVFIAEGKQISMTLASFSPKPDMKLFFLDEEKGWQFEGKPTEQEVEQRDTLKPAAKQPKAPVKPERLREGVFVFSLSPDYNQFPELKAYKGVEWQYAGSDSVNDPQRNRKVFERVWTDFRLVSLDPSQQTYALTLTTPRDTFVTVVKPAFRGKNYEKAMEQFQKRQEEYEDALAQRVETENLMKQQPSSLYQFGLRRFGTWNCDVYASMLNAVAPQQTTIKVNGGTDKPLMVYHQAGSRLTLLEYPAGDMAGFRFPPGEENQLVVVLKSNRAVVVHSTDFALLDLDQIASTGKCEFNVTQEPIAIKGLDDLSKLLMAP